MLTQNTTKVWQCDGLNCPTPPVEADNCPYYNIEINPKLPQSPSLIIQLCDVCIATLTSPLVTDYIAQLPPS